VHELGLVRAAAITTMLGTQVEEAATSNAPACVGPSAPTKPRAVDGEAHRQALQRDVVHDLVVAALQEGRVDRATNGL
jgi:hypothetical protein